MFSKEAFKDIIKKYEYEEIAFLEDKDVGLRAIICIHSTILGPALGGVRIFPYQSEKDAVVDVLRLGRAMTYKASAAGLDLGGGKSVIIGDPSKDKNEALLRAFGKFVDSLNGRYIAAEDVGTGTKDIEVILQETKHVAGISEKLGGSGDPSPVTARGVFSGMKACLREVFGSDSFSGKKIAIQGIAGKVGSHLAELLSQEGAVLFGSEMNQEAAENLKRKIDFKLVPLDEIYDIEADVFSPCAMGGILNNNTIPKLKVKIVAGSANNQLLELEHGNILHQAGIIYAPDYIINAGGLINVAHERNPQGYLKKRALADTEKIYERIKSIINVSKKDNIPTYLVADKIAEKRINN
ncbi:MAG: Glu/Leu/Phe/Val dehydrogenase [Candidatus Omnitrophica bacterium]|nr:Glu/Leu/Phe/Val dehydrogenase [Candidatus Omnitrophota bacterium]